MDQKMMMEEEATKSKKKWLFQTGDKEGKQEFMAVQMLLIVHIELKEVVQHPTFISSRKPCCT
jgi:hypothetical protein